MSHRFKRKADVLKEKRDKQVSKLIYKEMIIDEFKKIVKDVTDEKVDPQKGREIVNFRWSEFIKKKIETLKEAFGIEEALMFRSQISGATAKINNGL